MRQVLGAVAQLDKAMTVAKPCAARDRKRRQAGWCEAGGIAPYPRDLDFAPRLFGDCPSIAVSPTSALTNGRAPVCRVASAVIRLFVVIDIGRLIRFITSPFLWHGKNVQNLA